MTDEQKAELHDLLDTLVYTPSVQLYKREKAFSTWEEVRGRVAKREVKLATATT